MLNASYIQDYTLILLPNMVSILIYITSSIPDSAIQEYVQVAMRKWETI